MKLPIFKAIGMTIAFVFGNLIDIIKIMWLPLAIMMGAIFWLESQIIPISNRTMELGPHADPQEALRAIGPMFQWIGLLFLVILIFLPMIYAGLLRFVIRGQRPGGIFYLRFGGDEFRILITFILLMLLIMCVAIGVGLVFGLLVGGAAMVSPMISGLVGAIGSIVVCIFMIWIALRLSLSIPAAVGAEKIGIGPSWSVTKGNVWHLFGYWLLWYIFMAAVGIVFLLIVMPDYFTQMNNIMQIAMQNPDDQAAVEQAMLEWQKEMMASMQPRLLILCVAGFLVNLLIYPIFIVAGGVAYRLIKGDSLEAET